MKVKLRRKHIFLSTKPQCFVMVSTKLTYKARCFGKDLEGQIHKKRFYILQPHKTVNTPSLPSDTLDKAIENIKYFDNVTDEMRNRRTKEKNSPGLGLIFLSTAISLIKGAWYVVYSVLGENIKSLFSRYRLNVHC